MRHITKQPEPKSLIQYKRDGGTKYLDQGLDISEIQQQLLSEQKGLCAYCLSRIHAEKGCTPRMIVEHFKCRTKYRETHPELELTYTNMFGVCKGGEDNPEQKAHCDKSKDKGSFHYDIKKLNPLNPHVESLIEFIDNGTIKSVDDDKDVKEDIKALNLNEHFTRINRVHILNNLKDGYKRVKRTADPTLVRQYIETNIAKWTKLNKQGYLPAYNLVALKFLIKRHK